MVELEGADATEKWLVGMVANEPKSYPKNTPAVTATASGEVDVALVNHYYLHRLEAEHGADYPVENHYFSDGNAASLVNVSAVSVLKSSANDEAALEFVRYLLSEEGQKFFVAETFEYPVVKGVATGEGLPTLESIRAPRVDFTKLANLETTVELLRKVKALP